MKFLWRLVTCAMVFIAASCSSSTPSRPSSPVPDISGAWVGEVTLTQFDGGECLATTFHDIAGLPGQFHASLSQAGTHVTATMDIDHTGAACTFDGSIDGNQLVLHATRCSGTKTLAVPCSNGDVRGLLPDVESLQGTIGDGRIDGKSVENDNVVVAGTPTSVGRFNGSSSFILQRP